MATTTESSTTTHAKVDSLKDELNAALPEGFRCRVRYIHTASKPCDPLFSAPPGYEPEKTRLASHLLTISITSRAEVDDERPSGVLVLGIEGLVYTTKRLTTVFVSKADSTGYLPQQRPSPVKLVTTTFLRWLSANERHAHPRRKLVVSLFARAQKQYLFPGSSENTDKHVLDDRQLIKWWARVLDPLFDTRPQLGPPTQAGKLVYDGYLTVPGYEGLEIKPFLPSYDNSSGYESGYAPHWMPGNPFLELAEIRGVPKDAPPRCFLPRFPDDPKARFMQNLDDEVGISEDTSVTSSPSKRKSGRWASIRDLHRFWEGMEFRQECSSGRVVGFIWLVIRTKHSDAAVQNDGDDTATGHSHLIKANRAVSPPPQSEASAVNSSPGKRRRKPLSGPIIPRQPRLKGGSSSMTATSELAGMLNTEPEDGLVLTQDGYDKAMQTLFHLDFANLEVATQSTSRWVSEVSSIGGVQSDWSFEVVGTAKREQTARDTTSNGNVHVNDLGGMIKKRKRKPEDQAVSGDLDVGDIKSAAQPLPAVNLLGGGMVRKKPKPTAA